MRFLLLLLGLMHLSNLYAASYPQQAAVPGGIVHVGLGTATVAPKARFDGHRVMVVADKNNWTAVVGVSLDETPGTKYLQVDKGKGEEKIAFSIKAKKYPTQHLKTQKKYVEPDPEQLAQIAKEKDETLKILSTWDDRQTYLGQFSAPVKGRLSSPFGLRRFFNKEPRSPHKGVDIAAPLGTPLLSPAPAVVLHTGAYYFNGNTVFLDHGQGLISMYCHMDRIKVKDGEPLQSGQIIGNIGKTGRVTGPHVHWAVFLNATAVDPLLFLPQASLQAR